MNVFRCVCCNLYWWFSLLFQLVMPCVMGMPVPADLQNERLTLLCEIILHKIPIDHTAVHLSQEIYPVYLSRETEWVQNDLSVSNYIVLSSSVGSLEHEKTMHIATYKSVNRDPELFIVLIFLAVIGWLTCWRISWRVTLLIWRLCGLVVCVLLTSNHHTTKLYNCCAMCCRNVSLCCRVMDRWMRKMKWSSHCGKLFIVFIFSHIKIQMASSQASLWTRSSVC